MPRDIACPALCANRLTVSLVTAVHNRAATIGDTLASISAQSYPLVEHIIQDGGSTDGTLELLHRHASACSRLESAADDGIYDAINRGIARATGNVVGLLHSDDVFARPDVLARVADAFADPAVDCVYGDLQYVRAGDTSRVVRHWTSGPYDRAKLRRGWMPPHPTFYIRRSLIAQLGDYDTSFRIAADYDAMLRWLWTHHLRPAYLPGVMVKMRLGGESNRSVGRIIRKSAEDYRALRRNGVGGAGALVRKNLTKITQFIPRKTDPP